MLYVGKTIKPINVRFAEHLHYATVPKPIGKQPYLWRAICAYGRDSFQVEQLAVADSRDDLNRMEDEFICSLGTLAPAGYNMRRGGDGGACFGPSLEKLLVSVRDPVKRAIHSELVKRMWREGRMAGTRESLKRMAAARKKERPPRVKFGSPEYRAKMSAALKAKCADKDWLSKRTESILRAKGL